MITPLKTLLRLNGPMIALIGLALLMGYENTGKEANQLVLFLYCIPIWAGLGNLMLYLRSDGPVAINPLPTTAARHFQERQRLFMAAGAVTAVFLLRWISGNDLFGSLLVSGGSYATFALIISGAYAVLLLNSMERAQPGILKQKAAALAPWDYPALLTAGLLMTLLYPLEPKYAVLDGLLAACLVACAGALYAEHKHLYRAAPPAEPKPTEETSRPSPELPPPEKESP